MSGTATTQPGLRPISTRVAVALLIVGVGMGLGIGLSQVPARTSPGAASAVSAGSTTQAMDPQSWQAYQSFRAGERAAAVTSTTPWQAYQSYRAGERAAAVPSTTPWETYQSFRAGERAPATSTTPWQAYQSYRQGERESVSPVVGTVGNTTAKIASTTISGWTAARMQFDPGFSRYVAAQPNGSFNAFTSHQKRR